MIRVHHLNNSRSQRILWLLEELGLPYEIIKYQRNPATQLAPESLLAVHPLGKSPVLEDAGHTLIESGAIIDYVVRKYGKGQLAPAENSPDYPRYVQWLHYAEGSAMAPVRMALGVRRASAPGGPLPPPGGPLPSLIVSEIDNHFGHLDAVLGHRDYFVGNEFSAADIQLAFTIQVLRLVHGVTNFPNLARFLRTVEARPAYRRAIERGGPYALDG